MKQGHIIEELNGSEHIYAATYDIDTNGDADFTNSQVLYTTSNNPTEIAQLKVIFEELTAMYQV